ncbi:MAG: hypothetical protein K940chlam9_01205 [Chlamydiae bacterium]|nr:hypothetical protein [Chlamydiota bacterium]
MEKLWTAFKEATLQTKLFWIVTLSLGLLTLALCLYPYIWFPEHRSQQPQENYDS